MRIVFAGTPEFAAPALAAVAGRHEVCLVVTQPDRPAGRGRRTIPPPVKLRALELGLRVIQPESINLPEAVAAMRALAPDALLTVAYGKTLTPRVLNLPRLGCFNIHASLLPKYRGAAPVAHAILNGETRTGVTIQRMAPEIDTGPVLGQWAIEIGPEETAGEVSERLARIGMEQIGPMLDAIAAGSAVARPQAHEDACAAPKLTKSDGLIPWHKEARAVCNFMRAMTPWPGAFTFHRSSEGELRGRLVIRAARPGTGAGGVPAEALTAGAPPGAVVRCDTELIVAAGEGFVQVARLQPDGRREMDAADFLRGHAVRAGDRFSGPE